MSSFTQGFETSVLRGVSESILTAGSGPDSCCSGIERVGSIHIEVPEKRSQRQDRNLEKPRVEFHCIYALYSIESLECISLNASNQVYWSFVSLTWSHAD